jgi:histidinol dehydrogenase
VNIGAIQNHREREGGAIIYPVYSRRSGGLSVGVNLFPDRKVCSFDCPYCEVFPFETDIAFNLETMTAALRSAILEAKNNAVPVKDICFSGNGEPTMSLFFTQAIRAASALRQELAADSKLIVITNGSGLLNDDLFDFLKTSARPPVELNIWLKLDAATEAWYKAVDRSDIPHEKILSRIRDFAAATVPFTLQTMICTIKGALPPPEENSAWVSFVTELAALSATDFEQAKTGSTQPGTKSKQPRIRAVQLYGKARPAPEDPLAEAAPVQVLEDRAAWLRHSLQEKAIALPVEVYE